MDKSKAQTKASQNLMTGQSYKDHQLYHRRMHQDWVSVIKATNMEGMLKQGRRNEVLAQKKERGIQALDSSSVEEMFFLWESSCWDVPGAFLGLSVV